jgi:hypothetical protein
VFEYQFKKKEPKRMSITADSTVDEIYASVGYPAPNEDDLLAWEHLDCGDGDLCGTYGETGYFNVQSGMFGWADWESFVDDCDTATTECSDVYTTDDYDGWTVGVYMYNDDLTALMDTAGDKFGVVFVEDEACWYVNVVAVDTLDINLGWNDLSDSEETIGEDYPAVGDLASHASDVFDTFGFGSWYT